jgi:signal transduction histidine kinase
MNDRVRAALDGLKADTESARLEAARELEEHADELSSEGEREVSEAFATEKVPWVRGALAQVLDVGAPPIGVGHTIPAPRWDEQIEGADPDVARRAINLSTKRVLHEVSAVVGRARVAARADLHDAYQASETNRQLTYLYELCQGLRTLSSATVSPKLEEFDLRAEVSALAESVEGQLLVKIRPEGPANFTVRADRSLLGIAVRNLLVNAAEATESLRAGDERVVVVTWGASKKAVHISVIDRGPGPAPFLARSSGAGLSTKIGHSGYGLATASEAMRGLGGEVQLTRNERGGATALILWPGLP